MALVPKRIEDATEEELIAYLNRFRIRIPYGTGRIW